MSKVTVVSRPNRITIASKGVQGPPGDVTPELLEARDTAVQAAIDAGGHADSAQDASDEALGAANAASGSASAAAASANLAEQARLLGATIGFSTKADMDASLAHPAGTLALVTNDATAANNGTYRKTGASGSGAWVQSADRVTGLEGRVAGVESIAARVESNSGEVVYGSAEFNRAFQYDLEGVETPNSNARSTGLIPVQAGDLVTATGRASTLQRPLILVYDDAGVFVRSVPAPAAGSAQTVSTTVDDDGFVRSQWIGSPTSAADGVARVSINEGRPLFLTPGNLESTPAFQEKADKTRSESLGLVWTQGGVNTLGNEFDSDTQIRTQVVKLAPGSTVRLSTDSGYQFAWNFSDNHVVPMGNGRYQPRGADQSIEVPEGQPYARFMLQRAPEAPTSPSDATQLESSLSVPVAYIDYVPDLDDYATKESVQNLRDSTETRYVPTYRTPLAASGGVVSIIDDDGKAELYSALYPFLNSRGVPFAAAVNPTTIGTAGYITLAQLKEMAANRRGFEVMSHGFQHQNMTGLTPEEQHDILLQAKRWFAENGLEVEGFVYPNGGDNLQVNQVVSQYHNAAYDYGGASSYLTTFSNIRNMSIKRWSFDSNMSGLLSLVSQAAAEDAWVVICTHVEAYDWSENGWSNLQTLIDHIQSEGCKIMLPSEAFHVFGNLLEADNGFRITAQGATIPAVS